MVSFLFFVAVSLAVVVAGDNLAKNYRPDVAGVLKARPSFCHYFIISNRPV